MNLRKINNFALKLALALGVACAFALSSLSVVQAQIPSYSQPQGWGPGYPPQQTMGMQGNLFNMGYQSGMNDGRWGQGFHPCRHPAYQQVGNPYARRAFIRGYLQGYFGGGSPGY